MYKTNEEKRNFCLKAELTVKQLKADSFLSPQDRTDAVAAMEAASLFVRGGIIRHGIKKEFCRDSAKLFRYMAAMDHFVPEDQHFFREVGQVLLDIFPEEPKNTKGKRR